MMFYVGVTGVVARGELKTPVSFAVSDWTMGQSDWLALIEQLGYGKRMLVELPIPDPATQPTFAKAVAYLTKARSDFAAGRYKETGLECRYALEALKDDAEVPGDTYAELQTRIKNVARDKLDKRSRFHLASNR